MPFFQSFEFFSEKRDMDDSRRPKGSLRFKGIAYNPIGRWRRQDNLTPLDEVLEHIQNPSQVDCWPLERKKLKHTTYIPKTLSRHA